MKASPHFPLFVIMMLSSAGVFSIAGNAQTTDSSMPPVASQPAPNAFVGSAQSDSASLLPDAPDGFPASAGAPAANPQRGGEPWEGNRHYGPFSRLAIGADISPLGIGIKSAVILSEDYDARMLIDFFNFDTGSFEIEGYRADANLHFFSMGAALDAYPRNSIWRLSAGLMVHNGNNISVTGEAQPRDRAFRLNGQTFYSAKPNAATGATPAEWAQAFWFSTRANLSSSSAEDSADSFPTRSGTGRFPPSSASLHGRAHTQSDHRGMGLRARLEQAIAPTPLHLPIPSPFNTTMRSRRN